MFPLVSKPTLASSSYENPSKAPSSLPKLSQALTIGSSTSQISAPLKFTFFPKLPGKLRAQKKFTLFPKLPGELRAKIWRHAIFAAPATLLEYLVTVRFQESEEEDMDIFAHGKGTFIKAMTLTSDCLLLVCKESRFEVNLVLKLCMDKPLNHQDRRITLHKDTKKLTLEYCHRVRKFATFTDLQIRIEEEMRWLADGSDAYIGSLPGGWVDEDDDESADEDNDEWDEFLKNFPINYPTVDLDLDWRPDASTPYPHRSGSFWPPPDFLTNLSSKFAKLGLITVILTFHYKPLHGSTIRKDMLQEKPHEGQRQAWTESSREARSFRDKDNKLDVKVEFDQNNSLYYQYHPANSKPRWWCLIGLRIRSYVRRRVWRRRVTRNHETARQAILPST